MCIGIDLSQ